MGVFKNKVHALIFRVTALRSKWRNCLLILLTQNLLILGKRSTSRYQSCIHNAEELSYVQESRQRGACFRKPSKLSNPDRGDEAGTLQIHKAAHKHVSQDHTRHTHIHQPWFSWTGVNVSIRDHEEAKMSPFARFESPRVCVGSSFSSFLPQPKDSPPGERQKQGGGAGRYTTCSFHGGWKVEHILAGIGIIKKYPLVTLCSLFILVK